MGQVVEDGIPFDTIQDFHTQAVDLYGSAPKGPGPHLATISPYSPRPAAHGSHGSHMKDRLIGALGHTAREGNLDEFCEILDNVPEAHALALQPDRCHPQGYAAIHEVLHASTFMAWD